MIKFLLFKTFQIASDIIPLKFSYALARLAAWCYGSFAWYDQKCIGHNLETVTGRKASRLEILDVFVNFSKYLIEFLRISKHVNQEYLQKYVKLENVEAIDRALEKGKGVIILSVHMGNWELGGVILSLLGYPLTSIALAHKNKSLNELFNKERSACGAKVVQLHKAGKVCMVALKNNELIALVADKDFSHNGIKTNFLNREVFLPKGPAALSLKTGAAIIPAVLIRHCDNTFTFVFDNPIFPPSIKETNDASIIQIIKCYIGFLEEKIRQYPTQWVVFREFDAL